MNKISLIFAIFWLVKSLPVLALDPVEKSIVENINQQLPLAIQELEQVVNINSGTMNFAGVKEVGLFFKQRFDQVGFKSEWIDGSKFNRAGHLVAHYGEHGPKLLLIGHLDTVFAKDDNFQQFQQINEHRIAGPGITDMKGGDVIILAITRALKSAGVLDRVQLRIVLTGDEERSGRPLSESKKAIIESAQWADIALGFEDGDGDINTAVIARRGATSWTLDIEGKPAHSSQVFRPDIGDGAIYEAARILNAFREQLSQEKNLTFNPGMIVGGTSTEFDSQSATGKAFGKNNVIAKTAKVTGDIRAVSPQQLAKAQRLMRQIVANSLNHTQSKITFHDGYPPMAPTDSNRELLSLYSQASLDLGYEAVSAVDPRRAGAADISFAANHVSMALDGLGLMGTGGHTKDEVADMTSFAKNMHKAAILIYRLSNQAK